MIELKNVTKTYAEGNQSLTNVNLQIDKGEFVFIVGGSGAGKTTLLKLLIGEDKPTSGSIRVAEQALETIKRRQIPEYRRKIGIVFRDFRLFADKTVYENVAFALRVTGEPTSSIRTKVMASLQMVELSDKVKYYPGELTGCEQQRVALARAIAGGPNVIIADEPCGNIDPIESRDLIELFGRIQSRYEKTVVVLTYDRELAESFEHRIVRLHRGSIVEDRAVAPLEDVAVSSKPLEETEEKPSVESPDSASASWDTLPVESETPAIPEAPVIPVSLGIPVAAPEVSLPETKPEKSHFPATLTKFVKSDTIEYDLSALIESGEMDAHTAEDLAIATMQILDLPELDSKLIDAVAKKRKKKEENNKKTSAEPSLSDLAGFEPVFQSVTADEPTERAGDDSPTILIPAIAPSEETQPDTDSQPSENESLQQTIQLPIDSSLEESDSTPQESVTEAENGSTAVIPASDSELLLPEKEGDG